MNKVGSKVWNAFENLLKYIAYKVLHITFSDEAWSSLIQFVKFGIVGVTNTFIGYLIYAITLKVLRRANLWSGLDIYVAQLVMFLLSVGWSFYWNNKIVFKKKEEENRNLFSVLMKTYVSYAFTSLFLSEVLLHLWVSLLGMNEYVAPIINLLITVPLNFFIQKFWAFRKRENLDEE